MKHLSADELREWIRSEIDRRDLSIAHVARRSPNPDGSKGITPNCVYQALRAEGQTRVGTLIRVADALGVNVEKTYRLTNLGIMKRRRLHDK